MGLDTVELLWEVEAAFQIRISNEEAERLKTVGQLNECIARLVAERHSLSGRPTIPAPEVTWPLLVPIVVETLGVAAEKVTPTAEWKRDLGAD
jgi:acyl carrier protein